MPVKQLGPRQPPPAAQALRDRLVAEWKAGNSMATQPVILEEAGRANQPIRVYVVWDDWAQMDAVERSELIMDAFEAVYGRDKSLNVAVAMGLTPAEADRMGIPFR
jgi:hypothetical protein